MRAVATGGKRFGVGLVGVAACTIIAVPAFAQISGLPSIPGIVPVPVSPVTPAQAQGEQGPVSVLERQRPEVQPVPINLGQFEFYPSLYEIGTFDSNIYASRSNPASDFIVRSRPDLQVDNGPGPAQLRAKFDMYAEDDRYLGHSNLSNENAGASLSLANDFGQGLTGISNTAYTYGHQDPSTLTNNTAGIALRTLPALSTFSQELGVDREFEPLGLILDGSYERNDFQNVALANGTTQNQTQLNGNTFRIGPKVAYDFAPDLRPYVEGVYARYAYDNGILSANEYQVVVGADADIHQLLRGTAFVGYKDHVYDHSATPTASGPTYGLKLTWFATELLTLSATGAQTYYDSTVTTAAGVHSTINTNNIAFEADYEALTNVIVSGLGSYETDSYGAISRTDNVYSAGIGTEYLMSRNLTALAQYQFSVRDSSVGAFDYNRNTLSVGLKIAF